MLAYLDIGLGLFTWLLLRPSHALTEARRLLAKHSLLTVYVAVLIAAACWPLIVALCLLGVHRE